MIMKKALATLAAVFARKSARLTLRIHRHDHVRLLYCILAKRLAMLYKHDLCSVLLTSSREFLKRALGQELA